MELVSIFKRLVCGHQGEREISLLWPGEFTCLFSGLKIEGRIYNISYWLSISLALVWGQHYGWKSEGALRMRDSQTLDFFSLTSGLLL